ncbi:MAG: murein biosynthesis integral membrane protein MurJ [Stappia sp.]|uniref:murein biosynthesis integral membrane protein MurJ n=1 Tax=Stappia sp. TaxID=1870903 RepID=UPI000C657DC9|nr:murein biosynthesis integral membrane protein MurJ [Stappia sp.]MAB00514.1 murein biosynthesis integral membrane protein MurJ [Stappia sp.]MBM18477.1 murein biosynthesis integral membrane protein MurJ [Stappia sp.]
MSLLRNFATVGGATMMSRVLGFVRDVMIAAFAGAGPVADAFFVAFRLPNLFRRLFAEGAFNSAFVPLFARALEEEGEAGARRFAAEILAALFWTLMALSALAFVGMSGLVLVLAPGFVEDPGKFDLAVLLSRITFPYLLCMSLVAFLSGILNTYQRFAAAAFAPVVLNLVMISVLTGIWISGLETGVTLGVVLACGVLVAGLAQLALLLGAVRRLGFSVPLGRPRLTPAVRRLWRLGVPGVIAGGITQINIVVGTIIASAQAGAVSYLYYADRIYQLPLGVVGIAIGVVLLPDLSRALRSGAETASRDANDRLNRALEFALALTLPAAVALVVVPAPIVSVLFERGAFGAEAAAATTGALMAFAIGLPAFVLNKVFSPAFFAREDTVTPMWFAGVGMVVNVVGALALAPFLAHVGIALATSIAGWVNTGLLMIVLWRRGHFRFDSRARKRLPLLALASVLMGAGLFGGAAVLGPWLSGDGTLLRFVALALLVACGLVLFAIFVQVTGAVDLAGYLRRLRKRGGRAPVPPAPDDAAK